MLEKVPSKQANKIICKVILVSEVTFSLVRFLSLFFFLWNSLFFPMREFLVLLGAFFPFVSGILGLRLKIIVF